jgi:glycosyltransferase involved in cell wall biosynthesis
MDIGISVVIPVLDEEENVLPLIHELESCLSDFEHRLEIIYVDDGSTDQTAGVIEKARIGRPHLRLLRHTRNYGQSAALFSGMRVARGEVVVTMDGDGQNPPHEIRRLLLGLSDEVGCVCGVRETRRDSWARSIGSRIGNGFRNWVTGDRLADTGCNFRAFRRHVLREVPLFNSVHRFLPTILRAQGYTVEEVMVEHRPRERGVTKYRLLERAWSGLRDCFGVRWYSRRAVPGLRLSDER